MQLFWLPKALENLKDIELYIKADKPKSAKKVAQEIKKATRKIAQYPQIGRVSLLDDFREVSLAKYPYRIFYTVRDNQIIISRILHNKQNRPD